MADSPSNKYLYWLLAAILVVLGFYLYVRPLPNATVVNQLPAPPKTQAIELPWPAAGQAALGAGGYGLLAQHNSGTAVPIGSTAKVITAIAVLKQKPIPAGGQGPVITLDSSDVDLFNSYYSRGGSVTKVTAGEQITELQALQSMLLPSSNNMADSLAKWAFGSVDSYLTYANNMIKTMGLYHTLVGDTNGFSDKTTSTADDLVKLGLAAVGNPAIASVVSQTSAQVPVAGTINNLNFLLGQDGVIGIKTGSTEAAGGCYIFAASRVVQNHKLTLVGAILGQPTLTDAIKAAPALITSSDSGFEQITVLHNNQSLGTYKTAWGVSAEFRTADNLSLFVWKGADIRIASQPDTIQAANAGTSIGEVTVTSLGKTVSSNLVLTQKLSGPSPLWRLVR